MRCGLPSAERFSAVNCAHVERRPQHPAKLKKPVKNVPALPDVGL